MEAFLDRLISFFLIEPLRDAIAEKLDTVEAPREVATQVTDCISSATPAMIESALNDFFGSLLRVIELWLGMSSPEALLAETAPSCASALEAARPFFAG